MGTAVLKPTDWLLLFLARDALGVEGPKALDPVRIQKGMFLLSQRGPKSARDVYTFRPYNWGPFSSTLYGDLDMLALQGQVEVHDVPGRTWKQYELTDRGMNRARLLADTMEPSEREWLGKARRFVTTRSFAKLLADVYEAFPAYATRTHFRAS